MIDDQTQLPIDAYQVYWDAGYLLDGDFVLLETIRAYDHNFYQTEIELLIAGHLYKF